MAQVTATGLLHGSTIELDTPVPPLDGQRVRVVLDRAEPADAALAADEQMNLWREWADHGPQGPLDEEAEVEFP